MLSQSTLKGLKTRLTSFKANLLAKITAQHVKYVLNGDFYVFVSYRDSIKIFYEHWRLIGARK